jgi:bacillithiol biosynthesis deacetylase BshB1
MGLMMAGSDKHNKYDLLVFGAHPDDVEVGCGGLIIKLNKMGYKSGLVILTQGEMGTGGTPEIRGDEVEDAARLMGAEIAAHLDMGDCRVEDDYESRLIAAELIRRHKPSIVFAPYWTGGHGKRQSHPDHLACGQIVVNAANYATFKKLPIDLPSHRINALFHYMLPPEVSPTFVVDITDEYGQWIKALSAHRSQFLNPQKDKDYFWSLESMARAYGSLIGARYGQGYAIGEPLKIENPFCLVGSCGRLPELLIEKKTSDEEH